MKRKLRVTAFITVLVMLACAVSVSAYDPIWDDFNDVCKIKGNNHVKMDMSVEGSGAAFDMLNTASYKYDLMVVTNDDQTKANVAGTAELMLPFLDSMDMNVWMEYNLENTDDFKYKVILQSLSGIFGSEVGEKYLVMDYEKIPQTKELMMALIEAAKEYENTDNSKLNELKEKIYSDLDDIKPTKDGDTYSFVISMTDIKKIISNNKDEIVEIISDMLSKYGKDDVSYEETNNLVEAAEKADISDLDFSIELKIKDGRESNTSEIYCEMNINFDLYEISKAFSGETDETAEQNKDMYKGSLNIKMRGTAEQIGEDYEIDFPVTDESNSIDIFNDFKAVPLSEIFSNEAMSIGIIPSNNSEYNKIIIKYNGNELNFKNRPFVKQDRTFIALRELANILGIPDENIFYDEKTEEIRINFGGVSIEMQIGSQRVKVNEKELSLDVPAFTVNDRTYIPVRFISEMFGKNVDYNDTDKVLTVTIDD